MGRRYADIWIALSVATLSVALVLADLSMGWLRTPVTLLLAVAVPGYVLSVAFFPRDRALDRTERAVMTLGLSLAVSILGGHRVAPDALGVAACHMGPLARSDYLAWQPDGDCASAGTGDHSALDIASAPARVGAISGGRHISGRRIAGAGCGRLGAAL
ncbi:MAG TPA: DUF1616 domain-containing protein [Chloroflexi bacterium]|nr:DUF1616 domain-containing protein [Chloroflexota bacterium]